MVEAKHAAALALGMILVGLAPKASALVVVDPVNLVHNAKSAVEALRQVALLQAQIQHQVDQLKTMREQLKSMNPSQLAGLLGDITGIDELNRLEKALAANRDLIASIETVKKGFDDRLDSAKLMKLTWNEYVEWEKGRLVRKEESALARVNAEVQAMRRIESDYKFAREQAGRITATAGTHEAMQLMNVQMNRFIQQNAEVIRQLSTAFGRAAAEREIQEAEDKARAKAQEDAFRRMQETARENDRAALQAWNEGRKR